VIPRQTLADRIREYLIEQVVAGVLQPGERVREMDVARQLGVSQGPVREALRALSARGLVTYEPNRGSRIRDLDDDALLASFPVRASLEALAGTLAAPHLAGSTQGLEGSLAGMRAGAEADDIAVVARHSIDFHRQIVDAAHNTPLLDAWQALGIEILTPISLAKTKLNLDQVAEEHLPVLEALDAGDGEQASALLATHSGDYGMRVETQRTKMTDAQSS
jgi:DNA-binding GntR family transcriptional regulator